MFYIHFGYKSFTRYVFGKDFSPSLWIVFHSLNSVFHNAEVLNFSEIQLINFFFHELFLKSHCQTQGYLDFLVCYLWGILLFYTFMTMISFELIFVSGIRSVCKFIFLYMDIQLCQGHLSKRLSFLHCIALILCQRIFWVYLCGSISGLFIPFYWACQ